MGLILLTFLVCYWYIWVPIVVAILIISTMIKFR